VAEEKEGEEEKDREEGKGRGTWGRDYARKARSKRTTRPEG
jgi:hypothetical protein